MIEARATIKSIESTKKAVIALGAKFKSDYILEDTIYSINQQNLIDDYVRIRVNVKNDWDEKKVIVIRKKAVIQGIGKIDNIVLRKEFDTKDDAIQFIEREFSEFENPFTYSRKGWHYELKHHRIFIEYIEKLGPVMEIETKTEQEIKELFEKIRILRIIKESIPDVMKKLLMYN